MDVRWATNGSGGLKPIPILTTRSTWLAEFGNYVVSSFTACATGGEHMRLFLSVDMEGTTGLERLEEIFRGLPGYDTFRQLMAGDATR
jgi:hypothetical protein